MSCKYDIIDEGGRKRVRALRHFTVQGRDVCPMELGGYVYDEKTLSQDGNCWIFSGSLEYPGVRVMDEAIVDMGNNLPKSNARPKATIISGNSRIMGAISFETGISEVAQTPAMFEQGTYNVVVGNVPIKTNASTRVRIPVPLFAGTVGKVAITSTAYEARLISLNEAGIITSATAWIVGGPAVTLTSTAPYILVVLRKVGETAMTPADVTAAGVTITRAREAMIRIFNSSIVPVYNGSVTLATSILRYEVIDPGNKPYQVSIQNSYLRIECDLNAVNIVRANADFIKVNYQIVITPNETHYISGTFRNTNINTPASVGIEVVSKGFFDVSDCPNFEYSTVTFPDLAAMNASGKTFYFKQCNMPVGSAIHYYDPKVNVWDNIDFTKASEHLGKTLLEQEQTILVSSNVEGMYRLYRNADDKVFGMLVQDYASVEHMGYGALGSSYDSVVYSDCVLDGVFNIIGCNVFGGTLGGASKVQSTVQDAVEINGNFRIEGNAQVVDTPLKGTGYIGDNAELKNGKVEGYIYMQDNAKYIPAKAENPSILKSVVMRDNSKVLKQRDVSNNHLKLRLYDNATINSIAFTDRGTLIMRGNSYTYCANTDITPLVNGTLEIKDDAKIDNAIVTVHGDVQIVGSFNLNAGSRTIYGKHVIASPDDVNKPELPPTKKTW
uniref:Putative transferase, nesg, ydcK, Structural Genomics.38A n=1 Tax=Siphoviridae sp. ctt0c4 TaxID=2825702 RepID=A0A8S5V392_9CAUD|nr:MAG TPA: putative transferase, nesg, ydcK, Structural Genomics.38A [Siphoviridae sp. ctt0c4]